MLVFLCGLNSNILVNFINKNNNIVVKTEKDIDNINNYHTLNPKVVIYIFPLLNETTKDKYMIYEELFDNISCPYILYKINGTDNIEYIIKCINKILSEITEIV